MKIDDPILHELLKIVLELLKKGYVVQRDAVPEGHVAPLRLLKEVEEKPLPGKRTYNLSRYDFSHLTQSKTRHVEYELFCRFKTEKGEDVEVKFFNVREDQILDKIDGLEHEISLAYIALAAKFEKF